MADQQIKAVNASIKNLNISPRKVRLVTDLIKGHHVTSAMAQLQNLPNRASHDVAKLLNSALANAREKNMDLGRLVVDSITVDKGRVLKRARAKARGRVGTIEHKHSHVNLILKESPDVKPVQFVIPQKVKKVKTIKEDKPDKEKPKYEEPQKKEQKKAKKGFMQKIFRRKSI